MPYVDCFIELVSIVFDFADAAKAELIYFLIQFEFLRNEKTIIYICLCIVFCNVFVGSMFYGNGFLLLY